MKHCNSIAISKLTPTCWQMLAYRARTLAFSKMASSDGVVLLIFSTQRHLAKSAPSFLYCAQRSDSPSRPALPHTHRARHQKEAGVLLAAQHSVQLTLSGCLSVCSSERDDTFVHLRRQKRNSGSYFLQQSGKTPLPTHTPPHYIRVSEYLNMLSFSFPCTL